MRRYLIYFSYIGTGFRGIQRQIPRGLKSLNAVPTVSQTIEEALMTRLGLKEPPVLKTASRTDAGVHALRTAAHVDLDCDSWRPESLTVTLNYYFSKINCPIRIESCRPVAEDFDARRLAVRRSYLYRLAVLKRDAPLSANHNLTYLAPTPISEHKRCHFVTESDFDVDKIREVLPLLSGTKDYCSFMAKLRNHQKDASDTVRTVESVELKPGHPLLPSPIDDFYDYWHVTCVAKSFLFRQVRRTVAVLLAVGRGHMTYNDVEYLLDYPSLSSWNPRASTVPAHGLYLSDVVYNKEDLIEPVYEDDERKQEPVVNTSPKDLVGLSINEKINLRLQKLKNELEEKKEGEEEISVAKRKKLTIKKNRKLYSPVTKSDVISTV